jgi:predicted RNA binding protein YcfA (HicA-like mRNA interferase family)
MPKLTAVQAESLLLRSGCDLIRTKGSHRIYKKGDLRVVVPFHRGKTLHPKIVKQVIYACENDAGDRKSN